MKKRNAFDIQMKIDKKIRIESSRKIHQEWSSLTFFVHLNIALLLVRNRLCSTNKFYLKIVNSIVDVFVVDQK